MAADLCVSVVMMVSGETVAAIDASSLDSVLTLKEKVAESSGIPVALQRLFDDSGELLDATKLDKAALRGSPEIYLVNRGVVGILTDAGVASYDGENVAEAAQLGALGDVIRLVEAGADINAKYDYGYTALHHMAAVPGSAGGAYDRMKPEAAAVMMRWLCDNGADVNGGDDGGKAPLHVFCKYGGHMDQLHLLLEKNADVNQRMNYGDRWTPLWYCRNYRRPIWKEVEAVLMDLGARQDPATLDSPISSPCSEQEEGLSGESSSSCEIA